jgi:heat-inducible transcriptional repressor
MHTSHLDERQKDVLRSVIQIHITTGEPVGSESLARHLNRTMSSATLRNVMAELEKLGYLDHPHTSAGRMPTDEGYRVFVDSLMSHEPLARGEAAAIESELRPRDGSPSQVMEQASQLLSRLSRNVGFVLVPDTSRTALRHIDLVKLPHPRVLAVVVSRTGLVTHRVIDVEDDLTQEQLQECANYLNANFSGLSLDAIRERLVELMREEKALYDSLLQKVVSVGSRAFELADDGANVYLGSASNMLNRPEFEDLGRMRTLFKTFEEKGRLVRILNACLSDGLRVFIGHEVPDPELQNLSLVTASYAGDGEKGWGLGVLGSTRMEYARVIALVDHMARSVAHALEERRK